MTLKLVDAMKIRNSIDTDFLGAGSHGDYPYIPLGEFWLDKRLKEEKPFFLALWKLERSMRGKSFRLIREKAKKEFTKPKGAAVKIVKTEKRSGFTIRTVDGANVRTAFDPYFLLGGHDKVYSYIPKNEIWIETIIDPKERRYVLQHIVEERERMARGMSHDDAHDFALAAQRMLRRKDGVAEFVRG